MIGPADETLWPLLVLAALLALAGLALRSRDVAYLLTGAGDDDEGGPEA